MKILQINSVVNKGSTGRIAENIGLSIIKEGWSSYIAYGRGKDNQSKSYTYRIGSTKSNIIHALGTRLTDRHGFFSKKETNKLIEKIEKIQPDLIHLHNIHGYYLNIEVLFKYLSKVNTPVVWTLHDCWAFTGHCAHYSAIKCFKWISSCYNCPQSKFYPKSLFIDNSHENYSVKKELFTSLTNLTLVTVSNWLKGEVEKSFLSRHPIKTILNGINLNIYKDIKQRYIDTSKFILLSLATSWSERKGLNDLIELNKYLNDDECLVLVGLNKKQIKSLPPNIVGLERTESQEDLAKLYSQAGVVLSLSVEETFGLTIAEGFACGTPAIVYNSTATPELITEDTGAIVEPHDIVGIRKAIDKIRNSTINYKKACRARAENLYNKDDRYQDYIALYKELLNIKNDTIQR